MAALVVVSVSSEENVPGRGGRIGIFPGEATPAMYPADVSFWVGYGFAADSADGIALDDDATRFELDVDGVPVSMLTELQCESDVPVRKTHVAEFPSGLAGWHDLSGRWYDGGRLILSSRVSIQFVEP